MTDLAGKHVVVASAAFQDPHSLPPSQLGDGQRRPAEISRVTSSSAISVSDELCLGTRHPVVTSLKEALSAPACTSSLDDSPHVTIITVLCSHKRSGVHGDVDFSEIRVFIFVTVLTLPSWSKLVRMRFTVTSPSLIRVVVSARSSSCSMTSVVTRLSD